MVLAHVTAALADLVALQGPPSVDLPGRGRGRGGCGCVSPGGVRLWRTSHPFDEGVAVRVICWFPPGTDVVVACLFAGDKTRMGDVFFGQRRSSCRRGDRAMALRNPR